MAESARKLNSKEFHRKVRSGCRTCKYVAKHHQFTSSNTTRRRKVKCDEKWPVCSRCQSAGRRCDGYGVLGGGHELDNRHLVAKNPQASLQVIALQTNEMKSFEWYIQRSTKKLLGLYPSDYWHSLVIQASATEPAIRHALLMLSSAHKEEVSGSGCMGRENNDAQAIFTMTQYSKALSRLRIYVNDGGTVAQRAPLIVCALLVSSEFLRGHYASGILHLEYGLLLLRKHLENMDQLDPVLTRIDGWLITMFTRVLVQAKLFGQMVNIQSLPVHLLDVSPKYETFNSIDHARRSLEHIILHTFDIHVSSQQSMTDMDRAAKQSQLRNALSKWTEIHRTTLRNLPSANKFFERLAYNLLLPYSYMSNVLIETCLNPSYEISYDKCEPLFHKIISHCLDFDRLIFKHGQRQKHSHRDPEKTSPNSVIDIGWVAPLFFTAVKCRNHHLRHAALRLLRITTHKEGIWSTPLALKVASFIVESEEGSFYAHAKQKRAAMIAALPGDDEALFVALPAERRMSNIRITLPVDRLGTLELTYCLGRGVSESTSSTHSMISRKFDLRMQEWSTSQELQNIPIVTNQQDISCGTAVMNV